LIDAVIVDMLIDDFLLHHDEVDFVTNAYNCGFPAGADVNVYKGEVLKIANQIVGPDDPEREHVGFNISKMSRFNVRKITAPSHWWAPELYFEVDTQDDFYVVSEIIEHFHRKSIENFSTEMIIKFLQENPDLVKKNSQVTRRWASKVPGRQSD